MGAYVIYCQCGDGWYGDTCEEVCPVSDDGVLCGDDVAECVAETHECICPSDTHFSSIGGWCVDAGENCDGCVHGSCIIGDGNGMCECEYGWGGYMCEVDVCGVDTVEEGEGEEESVVCGGHGECVLNDKMSFIFGTYSYYACSCDDLWHGELCTYPYRAWIIWMRRGAIVFSSLLVIASGVFWFVRRRKKRFQNGLVEQRSRSESPCPRDIPPLC
ncbi:hypothetical protein ADUPG1_000548 [Aduncisulcus paluster]|nr:hypothetical protein ADUPG1_000548 [Aduncisulcus paluster]